MCDKCVADGFMTVAQADQQKAAIEADDMAGFVKPILEALGISADLQAAFERHSARTVGLLTKAARSIAEDNPSDPDNVLAAGLAQLILGQMDASTMASTLAEVAIRLHRDGK